MNDEQKKMAAIFNEWAKRYSENPDDFSDVLGDDGKPVADYGQNCARFFKKLEGEMSADGTFIRAIGGL